MEKPTAAELEILSILWELETANVRQVHSKLEKETGYTTTLKIMQNMFLKGLLIRDEANRTHLYKAAISQENTQQALLKNFVSKTFGGSAKTLVMQALGQNQPSPEEIDEIREFLDKIEKDNPR